MVGAEDGRLGVVRRIARAFVHTRIDICGYEEMINVPETRTAERIFGCGVNKLQDIVFA
jgi:hypothetical protein